MRGLQANSPTGFLSTAAVLLSSALSLVSAQTTTLTSFAPLFTVPNEATLGETVKPNILDPNATDAQTVCPGYTASGVQRNQYGFTAKLNLAGNPCNVYGYDIDDLTLTVEYQSADRLHVLIRPTYLDSSNTSWYVLSEDYVPVPKIDDDAADTVPQNDLGFYWSNEPSFGFSVIRQSTGDVLFSSMGTKLVYENQFLEFATTMPSNYNVYGLSETIHEFRMGNNFTKTFWNADVGDPVDYNIYGSHPFYLDTRYYEVNDTTGEMSLFTGSASDADPNSTYISNSHILYNRNSHGQDILLRENNITWRALGGSMDLYFFSGPTVKEATSQYQNAATGLPAMQQYWTFGYHQCRWGYQNWSVVEGVVDNFAAAGIPLETVWNDIDYMDFYRDFENSPNRFPYDGAATLMEKLRNAGQHYVPIVDSAVYVPNPANASDAYPSFDSGNSSGAFLLNPDGSLYIGDVWPGYTVFPDWLDQSGGGEWWAEQFKTWYDKVQGGFWSGIWIDMSEASSFCTGSCGSGNLSLNPVHPPFALPGEKFNLVLDYPEGFNLTNATAAASASSASVSQSSAIIAASGTPATPTSFYSTTPTATARNINYPPYVINNVQGFLGGHAVSPNATHHDGNVEYDVHNIWGLGILNATYQALAKVFPGDRPFIIGRSTFVSAGKFAGHWGGDNYSKFYYMYISISQALQFSLAGIPMFGVDTCGFNGNTDYELCSRWMQLSAFFPFYRNHNTLTAISQEPYIWESVTEAAKTAMGIRFNLLPYMYTLFYHAAKSGDTVLRAMSWEIPYDPSLASADRQLFLGPAILVTPVLEHNASTVNGVFPGANKGECYYDWYTQEDATQMGNVTIDAPLGHIPVYIRGGYVLPMQQKAMVTRDARMTPWSVLVALSKEGTAAGDLYLDDGVSVEPNATSYTKLSSTGNALYASTIGNYSDSNPLANVTVLGVQSAPGSVTLNGMNVTSLMTYNQTSKVMVVNGLQNATGMGAWAQDWAMKWS